MPDPEQTVPELEAVMPIVGVVFTLTVNVPCEDAVVLQPPVEVPVTV
jgi:hypothetical protein